MTRQLSSLLVAAAIAVVTLCGCGPISLDRLPSWLGPDYSNVVPSSPEARGLPKEIIEKVSQRLHQAGQPHDVLSEGDVFQTLCWYWPIPQPHPATPQEADSMLLGIKTLLARDPVIAYKSIQWRSASETVTDGLVVCPSTDQLDILRFERTEGISYGLYTEDILQDVATVDAHYKVDIVGASPEAVELVMRNPPAGDEALAFGAWLFRLCPDLGQPPTAFPGGRIALWWR
jgi:hypothetical protein